MPELYEWARAQDASVFEGESLSVANVAPGSYTFCVVRATAREVCYAGSLSSGGGA
jgi:hypothetical protein